MTQLKHNLGTIRATVLKAVLGAGLAAGLAVSLTGALAPTPATAASFSEETMLVQRTLVEQGYEPGIVDGYYGPATADAIRQFQADWKVDQSGTINPQLIQLLTAPQPKSLPLAGTQDCYILSPSPRPQEAASWTGECDDGRPTGPGVLTWTFVRKGETKTETLDGTMDSGLVTGEAVFVSAEGGRYEGEWLDGKPHGAGKFKNAQGDTYEGAFLNGVPHGQGKWISVHGDSFEGAWEDGLPQHLKPQGI